MDNQSVATPLKKGFAPRRTPVQTSGSAMVRTSFFDAAPHLPLVVEPQAVSLNLAEWARGNRTWIDDQLSTHGGLLFRGFLVDHQWEFETFVSTVTTKLLEYVEQATPRTHLSPSVYSSTEFPPAQRIMPHNELSYVLTWPTRIWFYCVTPAEEGGATPIFDVRRVLRRIPAPIRQRFENKGWMLVRNYGNGMALPWRTSFGVKDEAELEAYCLAADVQWEWLGDDRLRTRHVRPAMARHPKTREAVWFNHAAFWHLSSLAPAVRESMLTVFTQDEVPYHTYYGDGSPIDEADIRAISDAYTQEMVEFTWRAGDVLMLDNMLVAHGRAPYAGARRILVSMGDPCSDRGVDPPFVGQPRD
jgi:alpha-ketoglutarate-dependent taurine dioxygenase